MKKLFFPFSVAVAVTLSSCGGDKPNKADDIKTSDLKSACDCVDAMEVILDEMAVIVNKEAADMKEEDKKEAEKLGKKIQEISAHCQKEFKKEDAEKCSNAESLKKKGEEVMSKAMKLQMGE